VCLSLGNISRTAAGQIGYQCHLVVVVVVKHDIPRAASISKRVFVGMLYINDLVIVTQRRIAAGVNVIVKHEELA